MDCRTFPGKRVPSLRKDSPMFISYDSYRIFYYVAKYKNFTQAANILMNSQPNITRSIKNLENELGCRLFLRSNRGVTLTPEGEKLYIHVAAACEQIQAGEEELAHDKSLENGIVSIGASETALHVTLLDTLKRFHEAYPGIRIRISNHNTPQAVSALKNGLVDFSVTTSPTQISRPLKEIPLCSFQEILIGGPRFAHLSCKPFTWADLLSYPLIGLGKETMTHDFYRKLFSKHHLPYELDMEVATSDQILPLAKNDLGIGFLPEPLARESLAKGDVCRIVLPEALPERFICLIKDTTRPLSVAAKELERTLLPEPSCLLFPADGCPE